MKSHEQNTKEVMTYVEKSSRNFFQSEDGQNWQAVVKINELNRYVLVKDGNIIELSLDKHCEPGTTAGKTFLKGKIHPTWDSNSQYFFSNYGHGPSKKLRAIRWNNNLRDLITKSIDSYLNSKTEKGSI